MQLHEHMARATQGTHRANDGHIWGCCAGISRVAHALVVTHGGLGATCIGATVGCGTLINVLQWGGGFEATCDARHGMDGLITMHQPCLISWNPMQKAPTERKPTPSSGAALNTVARAHGSCDPGHSPCKRWACLGVLCRHIPCCTRTGSHPRWAGCNVHWGRSWLWHTHQCPAQGRGLVAHVMQGMGWTG